MVHSLRPIECDGTDRHGVGVGVQLSSFLPLIKTPRLRITKLIDNWVVSQLVPPPNSPIPPSCLTYTKSRVLVSTRCQLLPATLRPMSSLRPPSLKELPVAAAAPVRASRW